MRILLFVLALLIASPAMAFDWTMCGGGPSTTNAVRDGECKQLLYDNSSGASFTKVVRVVGTGADLHFDGDIDTADNDNLLKIEKCVSGYTPSANTCGTVDNSMTGAVVTAAESFIELAPGLYLLTPSALDATDRPMIQIIGK